MDLYAHQKTTADFLERVPRGFITSDPGCVSADTEFLTPTGWKRIDRYTTNDKILQYDAGTGIATFTKPSEYIKKPCDTMWVFAPARGINQKLSPEHRVLYRAHDSSELRVTSAAEIVDTHFRNRNGFSGVVLNTFTIPVASGIYLSEAQLRIQVMCIADGHFGGTVPRCTVRLKKERKKTRLVQLLNSAGVSYKRRECQSQDGFSVFTFNAPSTDKEFTEFYWGCSPEQLAIIADEVSYWDGSIDQRDNGSIRFSTIHRTTADFVQYACAASGKTTSLKEVVRDRSSVGRGNETIFDLHIRNKSVPAKLTGRLHNNVYEEPTEDGFKYCFTVPTTFWVMRRNGYISVTGNTGKTASALEGFRRTKKGKLLVLAPLSILTPSWAEDICKFTKMSYMIAHGSPKKRIAAMRSNADVVITNHDAVKWIADDPTLLNGFSHVVIDEFTAFKNQSSQRSKAVRKIVTRIEHLWMMSGTPNSNTILDLWYPAFLVDRGQRLGPKFYQFRSQVCEPVQVGPNIMHVQWRDKPGIEIEVGDLLKDITIRFKFEDCIDIPENVVRDITLEMPPWLRKVYSDFIEDSYIETESGHVTAIHAGSRVKKALQLLSGAVYDSQGQVLKVHTDRYQLIMDLVMEREQCVVAFNYTHERTALVEHAKALGITYGVIDSSASITDRNNTVAAFQRGEVKVIFAHPQSGAHGLTLTKGTTTLWCSPTYNAELYQQFNKRIFRAGQTRKTETIRISYTNSKETEVYAKLDGKVERMESLLEYFQENSRAA